ncbi:MAG: hypothetical protein OHK0023_07430 [Anaerolineae bacterium]
MQQRKPTAADVNVLDRVALVVDLPEYDLWRGRIGTVVEIYDYETFEVEFHERDQVIVSLTLRADTLTLLTDPHNLTLH